MEKAASKKKGSTKKLETAVNLVFSIKPLKGKSSQNKRRF